MAMDAETQSAIQRLQDQVDQINSSVTKLSAPQTKDSMVPLIDIPQGPGSLLNGDMVDGIHATTIPMPNNLLPLGANGQFPASVVPSSGGGSSGFLLGNGAPTDKNILIADGSLWQSRAVSGDISVAADTGTLDVVGIGNVTTGVLGFANGGSGQSSYTDGQLLIGNSSTGGLSKATITAGSGVTVTNGHGSITIASSGGSSGAYVTDSYTTFSNSTSISLSLSSGTYSHWKGTFWGLPATSSASAITCSINNDTNAANYFYSQLANGVSSTGNGTLLSYNGNAVLDNTHNTYFFFNIDIAFANTQTYIVYNGGYRAANSPNSAITITGTIFYYNASANPTSFQIIASTGITGGISFAGAVN